MRLLEQPITPPAGEPVTVAECMPDLRLDTDALDASIERTIASARGMAEQYTGRRFMRQTVRYESTDWPGCTDCIDLEPFVSASVTYWDGAAWAPYADAVFVATALGWQLMSPTFSFPTLGTLPGPRVRIDAVVGYASAAAVPAELKSYVIAHVVQAINHPELMDEGRMQPLPFLDGLLGGLKTWR